MNTDCPHNRIIEVAYAPGIGQTKVPVRQHCADCSALLHCDHRFRIDRGTWVEDGTLEVNEKCRNCPESRITEHSACPVCTRESENDTSTLRKRVPCGVCHAPCATCGTYPPDTEDGFDEASPNCPLCAEYRRVDEGGLTYVERMLRLNAAAHRPEPAPPCRSPAHHVAGPPIVHWETQCVDWMIPGKLIEHEVPIETTHCVLCREVLSRSEGSKQMPIKRPDTRLWRRNGYDGWHQT